MYKLVFLFVLSLNLFVPAPCKRLYILAQYPANIYQQPPSGLPCATLSQIAANSSSYLQSARNVTLVLQQGYHHLDSVIIFRNVDQLVITSDNSTLNSSSNHMTDLYLESVQLGFYDISQVTVSGVRFHQVCTIKVESVQQFAIRDCILLNSNETALVLTNTIASIVGSRFLFNSFGTYRPPFKTSKIYARETQLQVGGALIVSQSNVSIYSSQFEGNSAVVGGAVFGENHSHIAVFESDFTNNTATGLGGGALYAHSGCNVTIINSTFHNNKAIDDSGGALEFSSNVMLSVDHCKFYHNFASFRGLGIAASFNVSLSIKYSIFEYNVASDDYRGVISVDNSTMYINGSTFKGNDGGVITVDEYYSGSKIAVSSSMFDSNTGGVILTYGATLYVKDCHFLRNMAKPSIYGGVMWLISTNVSITNCTFIGNMAYKGGVFELISTSLNISRSKFYENFAFWGGVLRVLEGSLIITEDYNVVENNSGYQGIVHFIESTGVFSGKTEFVNNRGSFIIHYSRVTFKAITLFVGGSPLQTSEPIQYQEGGAITGFHSSIFLEGTVTISDNSAENGGAIYATQSKVYVLGSVTISNNSASENGGGVYLYLSELICQSRSDLILKSNNAIQKGGGIHAASSFVKIVFNSTFKFYTGSSVQFSENRARFGGGICLETSSYFYILRNYTNIYLTSRQPLYMVRFHGNQADFGGALYVTDDTNFATCNSISHEVHSSTTECFLQTLALRTKSIAFDLLNIEFMHNWATVSGDILFGGLLDRCAVSPFSDTYEELTISHEYKELTGIPYGIAYLLFVSNIQDFRGISSAPVQLYFCTNNEPNSSYLGPPVVITTGETFSVSVAALDQVNHTVSATIRSSLYSHQSGLGDGQLVQTISKGCTSLNFTIFSTSMFEELIMYAEGPCKDAEKSQLTQIINQHFIM